MKKFLVVLLSVLLVLSLVSCNQEVQKEEVKEEAKEEAKQEETKQEEQKEEAKEETKETLEELNVIAPAGAPTLSMLNMMEKNKEINGTKVNYQVIKATDVLVGKLVSKEADFAIVPSNLALKVYNKGVPYQFVGNSVWGVLYIVSNEDINSVEELKGKEINMIGKGLTPDIIFRKILKEHSIDPDSDVTLNYVSGSEELAKTYITGKSNLSLMPEPMLTKVLSKREDSKVVLDLQKEWASVTKSDLGIPQACLIVNVETAKKHPELVQQFIESYKNSINEYNTNTKEVASYAKPDVTLLNPMIAEKVQPRVNIRFESAEDSKGILIDYFNVLKESNPKSIGGKLPDDNFFYEAK